MADAPEVVSAPEVDLESKPDGSSQIEDTAAASPDPLPVGAPQQQFSPEQNEKYITQSQRALEEGSKEVVHRQLTPAPPAYDGVTAPDRVQQLSRRERRESEQPWHTGFWQCCQPWNLFCEAFWCPCILAGKTHNRLKNPAQGNNISTNGYCLGCCALVAPALIAIPCHWIVMMNNRQLMRLRYSLKGSSRQDCLVSAFCPCCALVQEEKELMYRLSLTNNGSEPQGYTSVQPMSYHGDNS